MTLSEAQNYLNPAVGESTGYIDADDIKNALLQTYTDFEDADTTVLSQATASSNNFAIQQDNLVRDYIDSELVDHNNSTNVHGIADTAQLATTSDVNVALSDIIDNHISTTNPHSEYAYRNTIGNLLTDNQASIEFFTTGWGAATGSPTISTSGSRASHGLNSLRLITGSGDAAVATGTGEYYIPVKPSTVYTFGADLYRENRAGNVTVYIQWSNSSPSVLGNSGVVVNSILSGSWNTIRNTFVSPSTAAYARIIVHFYSNSLNDYCYVDRVGMWEGAGGNWAMPGTPITGLGTQISHPNIDDVLVQRWDDSKSRWQTVHYDSGWRDLAASASYLGQNDKTCQIRRVNNSVHFKVSLDATSMPATDADVVTIPVGFRPSFSYLPFAFYYSAALCSAYIANGTTYRVNKSTNAVIDWRASYVWDTNNAIPTSLSGTLASAAPN